MNTRAKINVLLIEDDQRLATLTSDYLTSHGLIVTPVTNGHRGLDEALSGRHHVVLLDIMLPGLDGIEICKRIRDQSDIPIIMITAMGEEADRVMGLELGADDYVPKPYSARELLARIRSVLRRARGEAGPKTTRLELGDVVIDPAKREVLLRGRVAELTSYEFDLLLALAERAGRVLSREQLMEIARGSAEEAFDRSVDVHISKIRTKLEDDPKHPTKIKTVRGVGYVFAKEDS